MFFERIGGRFRGETVSYLQGEGKGPTGRMEEGARGAKEGKKGYTVGAKAHSGRSGGIGRRAGFKIRFG